MFTLFLVSLLAVAHPTEQLSWDDCVKEIGMNNLDIKAARENISAYKYTKKAQWSGFLPTVSGDLSAKRGNTNTSLNTDNTNYAASLVLSQNIFSGFQTVGKLEGAQANIEGQEATYNSVMAQVSYNLQNAFAQVLYARDYIALSEANIKRRQENLNLVQLRFEGGMENKGSYLLSKASLEEAHYDYEQAKHLLQTAKQQLASVIGRKSLEGDIDIEGDIPVNQPEKNVDMEKIVEETPTHKLAISQTKAYKADLRVVRSDFYPSFDFTGLTSKEGNAWPLPNNQWYLMLSLSIPLFNGGSDYYSTYSAASTLSSSIFSQQQTDLDLLYSLRQTYNSFLDAINKVGVYRSFVEAATTRAKISRGKYNTGLLNFENWDIIENDLINKQKTYIQTLRDRRLAEASWLQVQGKGVF
ncbi:MAG: TolC family protein [Pseudomonadota bacterium]